MSIVAKILTPEAIADGKTLASTDPTDYSIHSDYQNVKYLDPKNYPQWPTEVMMPNYNPNPWEYFTLYSVQHNLGYIPIKQMYIKGVNGRVYKLPNNTEDLGNPNDSTMGTFEMLRVHNPDTDTWDYGTPDLSKQINIIMGNATVINSGVPTLFDVFNMIFVNESG